MIRETRSVNVPVLAIASLAAISVACGGAPDGDASDVEGAETASESLSAVRNGIWQPPEGQLITTIYYCYEDALAANIDFLELLAGATAVDQGLTDTWELSANIDFVGEGFCSTAAHASTAIRIQITNATAAWEGRAQISGVPNGMTLKFDTAEVNSHCGGLAYDVCVRHQAIHEFGHALGFGHESRRTDRTTSCPGGNPANNGSVPDELITTYDPGSILETSYCRTTTTNTALSTRDINGVRAVYGSGDNFCNAPRACVHVDYGVQSAIRFLNGRYLQPRSDGGVQTQDFVGTWERVRLVKVSGSSSSRLNYGDVVAIQDRWGNYIRGRDDNEVDKQTFIGPWEKWVVESPNTSFFSGSVLKNGPVRLRSLQWNKYLYVKGSTDVEIKSSASGTELRIHGAFMEL